MKLGGLAGDARQQASRGRQRNITAAIEQKKVAAQVELGAGADVHLALSVLKFQFRAVEEELEPFAFDVRLEPAQRLQQVGQPDIVRVAEHHDVYLIIDLRRIHGDLARLGGKRRRQHYEHQDSAVDGVLFQHREPCYDKKQVNGGDRWVALGRARLR